MLYTLITRTAANMLVWTPTSKPVLVTTENVGFAWRPTDLVGVDALLL